MAEDRKLEPLDSKRSKTPFAYEGNVLGSLREDQVPRFFGALTDSEDLPAKTIKLADLTAMQNRVDTGKTKVIAANPPSGGKLPVVVQHDGKKFIADGHHRLAAAWLNGEDTAKVRFKNLEPEVNTMKNDFEVRGEVAKLDADQNLVFGWASVVDKGGTVVDSQGDTIDPADLENAVYDYVLDKREAGEMHDRVSGVGKLVESVMLTLEKQKAMGIPEGSVPVGWWVGFKVDDAAFAKVKSGDYPMFSIGGRGIREPVDAQ